MDSQYFAQIKDPVEVRRTILSSSRQLIGVLQRYERIKSLRVQKLEKISKLRALNKEINLGIAKLKKVFPAVEMRVKVGQEAPARGGRNELKKLEEELKMIEDKISLLS